MAFTLNRQEMLNVALRNNYGSVDAYLLGLGATEAMQEQITEVANRMYQAANDVQDLFYGDLQPAKLSSTLIKLTDGSGNYVQFAGAGFKFTSTGNLAEKFADFTTALQNLAADPGASLKYFSVGDASAVAVRVDFSAKQIKLTLGTDVLTIKGDFPTKLSQIYTLVEEITGLNSETGFDPELLTLLALKPGSTLSKYDIDTASLVVNGSTLATAVLHENEVRLSVGRAHLTVNGSFPDNAADVYMALRDLVKVDKSGDFPVLEFVKTIGANSSLHDYNVDDFTIYNDGKLVASGSFSTTSAVITLGDFKLVLKGEFPNTAADIGQIIIDYNRPEAIEGAYISDDYSLTSLKLIDLADNSVLASTSGTITGEDLASLLTTFTYDLFVDGSVTGTTGVDKIYGDSTSEHFVTYEGNDTVYGRAGNDWINTGDGVDYAYGDAGNDFINTGEGADKIEGGAGNDQINGGAGNDWILGGVGSDEVMGGLGGDRFVFRDVSEITSKDLITDFSRTEKDRVDLSGIDANGELAGEGAFSFIGGGKFTKTAGEVRSEFKNGNTYLRGDIDGDGRIDFTITLTGTHTLSSSDFVL